MLKIGSLRLRVATSTAQFFIAMKRTRGYIMTLEGYVAKDFNSDAKQKTCRIPHIYYEYPVPQEKGNSRT